MNVLLSRRRYASYGRRNEIDVTPRSGWRTAAVAVQTAAAVLVLLPMVLLTTALIALTVALAGFSTITLGLAFRWLGRARGIRPANTIERPDPIEQRWPAA